MVGAKNLAALGGRAGILLEKAAREPFELVLKRKLWYLVGSSPKNRFSEKKIFWTTMEHWETEFLPGEKISYKPPNYLFPRPGTIRPN